MSLQWLRFQNETRVSFAAARASPHGHKALQVSSLSVREQQLGKSEATAANLHSYTFNIRTTKVVKLINLPFSMGILYICSSVLLDPLEVIFNKIY